MLPKELSVSDDGPIRHIRFNRPDKLNALTSEMQEGVLEALAAARSYMMDLAQIPAASYAHAKQHLLDSLDLSYDASLAHFPLL